jgi:hypothetical protein
MIRARRNLERVLKSLWVQTAIRDGGAVFAVQLVRGLVFASILWALVRHLRASRRAAALAAGLTLSLLGGVAPLLLPTDIFPDSVRLAHLFEVGISNFIFGTLAGWLLARSLRGSRVDPVRGKARLVEGLGQP